RCALARGDVRVEVEHGDVHRRWRVVRVLRPPRVDVPQRRLDADADGLGDADHRGEAAEAGVEPVVRAPADRAEPGPGHEAHPVDREPRAEVAARQMPRLRDRNPSTASRYASCSSTNVMWPLCSKITSSAPWTPLAIASAALAEQTRSWRPARTSTGCDTSPR